jgi:valyl-tRNA synthetase
MENIKDWNISRQLWWGQRIPAWYDNQGNWVVAKTAEDALTEFLKLKDIDGNFTAEEAAGFKHQLAPFIHQDEDVMDTWFSSWLWPISVFNGLTDPGNKDINYYYPTNDIVTAPEIMFFWVARMIMAGHEFMGKKPFNNVYLTGIVRDKLGRKMSKSLGNSPDPIGLIEKYGADGVRVGMLLCSPAGNDLMFDESYCEQGRNFANKIWNAFRLVKGWEVDENLENPNEQAIHWFENRFNQALVEIEDNFKQYRLSEALMATYKLVWDDFCAWYLEMVKPTYQHPIDAETLKVTIGFFEKILALLHPFMPFITEEIYHDEIFGEKEDLDCIIVGNFPVAGSFDLELLKDVETIKELVAGVRNVRNTKQLSPKEALPLNIKCNSAVDYEKWLNIVFKLANISEVEFVNDKIAGAVSFMVGSDEFYIQFEDNIDIDAERERLNGELTYLQGFLKSVDAKLNNERFVQNAKPEIIQNERNKKADAESKMAIIKENLSSLG